MANPLQNKTILLGVTGSIACYKAADLASKLAQAGAHLDVILTQAAEKFVAPLTFQSVTGSRAYVDADMWGNEGHVLHIGLARRANLVVIAPASANTLAKLAHGLADNLLSVAALAATCPLIVAPAMDGGMYAHPATQSNLDILRQRGVVVIGPAEGHLASGQTGMGRMVEPDQLLGHIRLALAKGGQLSRRTVVVTAGGTQEPIDPVRSITNRSSGKQGFALAQSALDMGAEVTLIAGSTALPTPIGARRIDIQTTEEMLEAVLEAVQHADVLIMAAAVADFKPVSPAIYKLKKESGIPEIKLETTPDILVAVAEQKSRMKFPLVSVGFAAESQNLLENARKKLESKMLDLIAANDITADDAGFAVNNNRITLIDAENGVENLPLMSKTEVADVILGRVAVILKELELP